MEKAQLNKLLEKLKAQAIEDGKSSKEKSIKDLNYGKWLAYNNIITLINN